MSTVTRTIDTATPPSKAWHWSVTSEKQSARNARYAKAYELLEVCRLKGTPLWRVMPGQGEAALVRPDNSVIRIVRVP